MFFCVCEHTYRHAKSVHVQCGTRNEEEIIRGTERTSEEAKRKKETGKDTHKT